MERTDQIKQKINLNKNLLEKLKMDLVNHKIEYAENQMTITNVIGMNLIL